MRRKHAVKKVSLRLFVKVKHFQRFPFLIIFCEIQFKLNWLITWIGIVYGQRQTFRDKYRLRFLRAADETPSVSIAGCRQYPIRC